MATSKNNRNREINDIRRRLMRAVFYEEAQLTDLMAEFQKTESNIYKMFAGIKAAAALQSGSADLRGGLRFQRNSCNLRLLELSNAFVPLKNSELLNLILIMRYLRTRGGAGMTEIYSELVHVNSLAAARAASKGGNNRSKPAGTERDSGLDERTVQKMLDGLQDYGWLTVTAGTWQINDALQGIDPDSLRALARMAYHCYHTGEHPSVWLRILNILTLRANGRAQRFDIAQYRYCQHGRIFSDSLLADIEAAIAAGTEAWFDIIDETGYCQFSAAPLRVAYDEWRNCWWLAIGQATPDGYHYSVLDVEQIINIESCDKTAQPLQSDYASRTGNAWLLSAEAPVKICARFDDEHFIRERLVRGARRIPGATVTNTARGAQLELTVNGTREILPWLLSFGSSVEVIEPAELRAELAEIWQCALPERRMAAPLINHEHPERGGRRIGKQITKADNYLLRLILQHGNVEYRAEPLPDTIGASHRKIAALTGSDSKMAAQLPARNIKDLQELYDTLQAGGKKYCGSGPALLSAQDCQALADNLQQPFNRLFFSTEQFAALRQRFGVKSDLPPEGDAAACFAELCAAVEDKKPVRLRVETADGNGKGRVVEYQQVQLYFDCLRSEWYVSGQARKTWLAPLKLASIRSVEPLQQLVTVIPPEERVYSLAIRIQGGLAARRLVLRVLSRFEKQLDEQQQDILTLFYYDDGSGNSRNDAYNKILQAVRSLAPYAEITAPDFAREQQQRGINNALKKYGK